MFDKLYFNYKFACLYTIYEIYKNKNENQNMQNYNYLKINAIVMRMINSPTDKRFLTNQNSKVLLRLYMIYSSTIVCFPSQHVPVKSVVKSINPKIIH